MAPGESLVREKCDLAADFLSSNRDRSGLSRMVRVVVRMIGHRGSFTGGGTDEDEGDGDGAFANGRGRRA